jgi:hypothetical protein
MSLFLQGCMNDATSIRQHATRRSMIIHQMQPIPRRSPLLFALVILVLFIGIDDLGLSSSSTSTSSRLSFIVTVNAQCSTARWPSKGMCDGHGMCVLLNGNGPPPDHTISGNISWNGNGPPGAEKDGNVTLCPMSSIHQRNCLCQCDQGWFSEGDYVQRSGDCYMALMPLRIAWSISCVVIGIPLIFRTLPEIIRMIVVIYHSIHRHSLISTLCGKIVFQQLFWISICGIFWLTLAIWKAASWENSRIAIDTAPTIIYIIGAFAYWIYAAVHTWNMFSISSGISSYVAVQRTRMRPILITNCILVTLSLLILLLPIILPSSDLNEGVLLAHYSVKLVCIAIEGASVQIYGRRVLTAIMGMVQMPVERRRSGGHHSSLNGHIVPPSSSPDHQLSSLPLGGALRSPNNPLMVTVSPRDQRAISDKQAESPNSGVTPFSGRPGHAQSPANSGGNSSDIHHYQLPHSQSAGAGHSLWLQHRLRAQASNNGITSDRSRGSNDSGGDSPVSTPLGGAHANTVGSIPTNTSGSGGHASGIAAVTSVSAITTSDPVPLHHQVSHHQGVHSHIASHPHSPPPAGAVVVTTAPMTTTTTATTTTTIVPSSSPSSSPLAIHGHHLPIAPPNHNTSSPVLAPLIHPPSTAVSGVRRLSFDHSPYGSPANVHRRLEIVQSTSHHTTTPPAITTTHARAVSNAHQQLLSPIGSGVSVNAASPMQASAISMIPLTPLSAGVVSPTLGGGGGRPSVSHGRALIRNGEMLMQVDEDKLREKRALMIKLRAHLRGLAFSSVQTAILLIAVLSWPWLRLHASWVLWWMLFIGSINTATLQRILAREQQVPVGHTDSMAAAGGPVRRGSAQINHSVLARHGTGTAGGRHGGGSGGHDPHHLAIHHAHHDRATSNSANNAMPSLLPPTTITLLPTTVTGGRVSSTPDHTTII